jgi:hypothetical protein
MPGLVITAKWQTAEVKALMRRLQAPRLNQALSVAVNDSARQLESKSEQVIAKRLSIPSKRAKIGIWIRPYSTPKTLTATVRGSGSPIPLSAFNAHESDDGVVATIWGAKLLHPGAFIKGGGFPDRVELKMGGHVFHRIGSKRLPIERSKGAAIAEAMAEDTISSVLVSHGKDRLMANLMRQLDRYSRTKR